MSTPTRRKVTITRPDGSTFASTEPVPPPPPPLPEPAPEPVPTDWDLIATRAAVGMVMTLTAVAVAWSTWSIGSLLHGGIGYLAAVVFDLSWATCLLLEWKGRFDKAGTEIEDATGESRIERIRPDFTEGLGWFLLAVTMGAIFWHAWPDVRYAVVGAVVSGVAKILWMGILRHMQIRLTERDRDDLRDRRSKAAVALAFASVDRQVMRTVAHTEAVRRSLATPVDIDDVELTRVPEQARPADPPRAGSGSVPALGSGSADPGGSGSVKDVVRAVLGSGLNDPATVLDAVLAQRPGANTETVKRMIRLHRSEGGYL